MPERTIEFLARNKADNRLFPMSEHTLRNALADLRSKNIEADVAALRSGLPICRRGWLFKLLDPVVDVTPDQA